MRDMATVLVLLGMGTGMVVWLLDIQQGLHLRDLLIQQWSLVVREEMQDNCEAIQDLEQRQIGLKRRLCNQVPPIELGGDP